MPSFVLVLQDYKIIADTFTISNNKYVYKMHTSCSSAIR
jgi:hypothetical protein